MKQTGAARQPVIVALVILIVASIFIVPCGGVVFPFEFVLYMAFGWIVFLATTLPKVRFDGSAALFAAAALTGFTLCLHWFLNWLYVSCKQQGATAGEQSLAEPTERPRWRAKWTLSIVAITLMMFVAGISMVGVTHQASWMVNDKQPLLRSGREISYRFQSVNNLKLFGLATQNYGDVYGPFPPGALLAENGKGLHGWQTLILPFAERNTLYEQVNLTQPWSSAGNRGPLSTQIPSYQIPGRTPSSDSAGYALTHYAANQHVIGGAGSRRMADIRDGTSHTLLTGEAAGNYKPWGSPTNWRDPALGINTSKSGFGGPWHSHGCQFVFADGHTQLISEKTDPTVLRALATPASGEKVSTNDF